jgi:hypothetical protein
LKERLWEEIKTLQIIFEIPALHAQFAIIRKLKNKIVITKKEEKELEAPQSLHAP